MGGPNLLRGACGQHIDNTAKIPDQPNINGRIGNSHHRRQGKNLLKGSNIFAQKRPQLARRRIGRGIGGIRVDKPFKEFEHVGLDMMGPL